MTHTPTYYRTRSAVRFIVGLAATATVCLIILWGSGR